MANKPESADYSFEKVFSAGSLLLSSTLVEMGFVFARSPMPHKELINYFFGFSVTNIILMGLAVANSLEPKHEIFKIKSVKVWKWIFLLSFFFLFLANGSLLFWFIHFGN